LIACTVDRTPAKNGSGDGSADGGAPASGGKGSTSSGGKGGSSAGKGGSASGGKGSSSAGDGGSVAVGGSSAQGGSASNSDGGSSAGGSGGTGGTPGAGTASGGAACKGIAASVTSATASNAPVSVSIEVADTGCTVASDFVGSNYEAFPGWGADTSLNEFQKTAFSAAGMQLFRFPGGAPGDWADLLMTGKCMDGSDANWNAPSVADLWSFAQSAGLHSLMLQTNPTPQWCGSGDQDASGKRAGEIAADLAQKGVRAVYEIGNEPDIGGSWFTNNGGRDAYIAKFIEHSKAIHAAAPDAEVYGPVVCGLGGNCGFPSTWDSGWIDAFLAQTGDKASGAGKGTVDGVSFHVYWHNEWAFSDLQEAKITKYGFALYMANDVIPYVRGLIAKHDSRDLPIAISEISIGNGVPNDAAQKQNMFSVLETADTIAGLASSGLRSFQWFDANAEGPMDFWLITKDATRPIYYSFVAWSKMGNHVLALSSDVNPVDVAAYATKRADGSVQVMLINKTDSAHEVTLSFDGYDPSGKALAVYTAEPAEAGKDTGTSVRYNGAADPQPSALPEPETSTNAAAAPKYSLPAFSLAVLTFGP
jgi:hypothetical protein